MIIGIGTDIVECARLAHALDSIRKRAFTENETRYAESHYDFLPRYAGRWAAKEAFAKALGTGFGENCRWQEVEIVNDEKGKPVIKLHGNAQESFNAMGGKRVHLSISHEKSYATAMVIIED